MTEKNELEILADQIRIETLHALEHVGAGHVGGCMSIAELLAVLYGKVMTVRPQEPSWPGRDWLIVSKGHCGPAVYAALALKGYFPMEDLKTVNQGGTNYPSHCDRNKTPGIDMTTGSLGQGMSSGIGICWANRYLHRDSRTYIILGDGELQEGQIWEGALFAAQQKLGKLTVFVDRNKKQLDGYTEDICGLGSISDKFKAFGWHAQNCSGHDVEAIESAIRNVGEEPLLPSVIILDTIKGKGCSFTEDVFYNHHVKFTPEQNRHAIKALTETIETLRKGGKDHVVRMQGN